MTYSSALFERPGMTLEEAQLAKYRRIADVTGLRPGMRVLEIGSGWGGFAAFAAGEIGCHRHLGHRVEGTGGMGGDSCAADRHLGRPGRRCGWRTSRLRRAVRRGDLDRDDRIHPRVALARVLPHGARPARAWRPGGPAGHHGGRPTLGVVERQPRFHPSVRVPQGARFPVRASSRAKRQPPTCAGSRRPASAGPTPGRSRPGEPDSTPRGRRSSSLGSTIASSACGSTTSRTARAGSGAGGST